MTQLQKSFLVCMSALALSVFSSATWAQSAPVYVSGGPIVYQSSGGSLTTIFTAAPSEGGTNFESLAVGPDYVDKDVNGNASPAFLLYACDTKSNTIVRFDPNNPDAGFDLVYNGSITGLTPECGRFTSTGDFYVTNKSGTAGGASDVYKFSGLANLKLGSGGGQTPTAVALSGLPSGFTGAGITQKNVGDLLVVDTFDNEVLRSPYGTPFTTTTPYLTGLNVPVGIARISTGDVFVANQGSSNVAHFDRTGAAAATCPTLTFPTGEGASTNTRIFYLASSETDTIFAATSTSTADFAEDLDFLAEGDNPGEVWSWSPGQACVLQPVVSSGTLLFGVAAAPVPTAPIVLPLNATVTSPTPTTFNFNSNEFQITAGGGCTATVTAYPLSLANINSMIAKAVSNPSGGLPDGATPLVNLGEGGFEIAYLARATEGCTSVFSDGSFANAIFGLYDTTLATNPRLIQCDSVPADDPTEPLLNGTNVCAALTTVGSYPVGGIPTDPGTIGTGHTKPNSVFFLANANFKTVNGVPQPAIFCGFFPPLKNTTDPTKAATFDNDDIILVAFRLAKAGGNCRTGPFDNNAKALLSIAQVTPTFNPIFPLKTIPQAGDFQPLGFGFYAILLPVRANHLGLGEYSLSVLFETDDTSLQSIVFNVVPDKD
jgi:hypothetical protein